MATKSKRRYKKKSKELGLFGVPVETTNKVKETAIETGLTLASALGGGVVGAAIGRPSLLLGLPIIILGIFNRNKYIAAGGLGMCLANGFQSKTNEEETETSTETVDGLDLDQMKERVGTFFKNFSDKLYLPKKQEETTTNATNGLGEAPTYFINPYNTQIEGTGEVDMSQLDRVQQEIANMGGLSNPDRIL